jgi:hypothetical protein
MLERVRRYIASVRHGQQRQKAIVLAAVIAREWRSSAIARRKTGVFRRPIAWVHPASRRRTDRRARASSQSPTTFPDRRSFSGSGLSTFRRNRSRPVLRPSRICDCRFGHVPRVFAVFKSQPEIHCTAAFTESSRTYREHIPIIMISHMLMDKTRFRRIDRAGPLPPAVGRRLGTGRPSNRDDRPIATGQKWGVLRAALNGSMENVLPCEDCAAHRGWL